jgi:hypothetical protein
LNKFLTALLFLFLGTSGAYAIDANKSLLNCYFTSLNMTTGHTLKLDSRLAATREIKRKELEGLNFVGIVPWKPRRRDAVTRWITSKTGTEAFMVATPPKYMKNQKLGEEIVNVSDIRWSQAQAGNISQDGKYSVIGNARDIKDGKLDISVLPTLKVFRDETGRIWTLDHRRLAAVKLSGVIKQMKVEFVSEEVVKAQKFKFSTQNDGNSILVHLDGKEDGGQLSVVVD